MDIRALGVGQLAKHTLLGHVADHHRFTPIAVVLGHHVRQPRLLDRLDQCVTLFESRGRNHLGKNVLTGIQRG